MLRNEAVKKIQSSKRIAIKVGTSLLTDPSQNNGINRKMIEKLREEILFLMDKNISPLLVTSGAVGMGRETLKRVFRSYNPQKDPEIVRKQALASIGQSRLMSVYADCFEKAGIPVAQLLITARDFLNRRAYVNIGNTIKELSSMGVLPIINENDTVCTEELNYGDNDLLSAACASLFQADLLVILTSVPGFIFNGERIPFLDKIGDSEMAQAHGPEGPGTGGMQTKLRAAQLCMLAGEVMTILPGRDDAPLQNLFQGNDIGTVIYYKDKKKLRARKRWLLYSRTTGGVVVDDGAINALSGRGSSLLPAGITKINGQFLNGDVIDIVAPSGKILGRGITNYSSREIQPLLGLNKEDIQTRGYKIRTTEIIHRDNLTLEIS